MTERSPWVHARGILGIEFAADATVACSPEMQPRLRHVEELRKGIWQAAIDPVQLSALPGLQSLRVLPGPVFERHGVYRYFEPPPKAVHLGAINFSGRTSASAEHNRPPSVHLEDRGEMSLRWARIAWSAVSSATTTAPRKRRRSAV
jgi:hypothetical protein